MEAKEKRNEVMLIILALLPIVYMIIFWKNLPDEIPVHYNARLVADNFASKIQVLMGVVFFNVGFYLLFRYIHVLDPKGKINKDSKVYRITRILVAGLILTISLLIVLMSQYKPLADSGSRVMILVIGFMFIVLGNYLPIVKQNYFIGVRTPWTLDNEIVWTKTHRIAGRAFFVGGLLVLCGAVFQSPDVHAALIGFVAIAIAIFSMAYSFVVYKKMKKVNS